MINVTIDGKKLRVPEGTTVLQAAREAEIFIPTLCDHPELTPYGGCRLCIVEVEGLRTMQPSCTLPVSNDMVVHTDTPRLHAAREFVLTLLFSERNHFCPYCQVSGGDCELQNSAYREGMTHWPLQPNWHKYPVDASHPNFVLDNNRCILCRRCVRACGELTGNFTLSIAERGSDSMLVADTGVLLGESTCVACGMCVQVCPTGALIDRDSAYQGRVVQVERTRTVCVGCSVGCGVDVLSRNNQLVRIEGDWTAAVNDGTICKAGRFTPMDDHRERLVTPLVRKNGSLKAATWDEALSVIADRVKPLIGRKSDGVAALISTRLPAESLALFKQLFANNCQSDMVTSIEEGRPTALAAALADELGQPFEGKLDDLKAADCVVMVGANLVDNHQVAGFFVKRNLPKNVKLVVIDPNENELDALADCALKPAVGTDAEVVRAFIAAAKGAEANAEIAEAAQIIGAAKKPVIVYGKGFMANNKPETLRQLIEWAKAINAKLIGLKGEANSLAAAQYGLDQIFKLNGHQVAYVAVGDDYPTERLIQRLEKAPFLVAQASYVSKLTARADVVLPVEMWAEQDGHYLNLDGRLQAAHKAIHATEEVRSNVAVLQELAQRLGFQPVSNWKEELFQRVPVVALTEA